VTLGGALHAMISGLVEIARFVVISALKVGRWLWDRAHLA